MAIASPSLYSRGPNCERKLFAHCCGEKWGWPVRLHRPRSCQPAKVLRNSTERCGYGSLGVFQGDLSPLSSHAVVESWVMLILLYGCENWVLTEQLISRLESFQGEVAKRILNGSSNIAACVVMPGWTTVRARVAVRKLGFLLQLVSAEERVWVARLWCPW